MKRDIERGRHPTPLGANRATRRRRSRRRVFRATWRSAGDVLVRRRGEADGEASGGARLGVRAALDERRRELEWMRGEIETHRRSLEPMRRDAEAAAERERGGRQGGAARAARRRRPRARRDVAPCGRPPPARGARGCRRPSATTSGSAASCARADERARLPRARLSQIESLELARRRRRDGAAGGALQRGGYGDGVVPHPADRGRARRKAEEDARARAKEGAAQAG